jgi:ABC-type transporter Mla MlaB component
MATTVTQVEDRTLIQLSGALTIMDALEMRDQLALAFSTAARVEVDLAEVIEIDCAGLQLLLTLPRESIPVAFANLSDPLRELLQHLNLLPNLGLEP